MLWELLSIIVPSIKSIDKNDMMQIVNTNTLGKFQNFHFVISISAKSYLEVFLKIVKVIHLLRAAVLKKNEPNQSTNMYGFTTSFSFEPLKREGVPVQTIQNSTDSILYTIGDADEGSFFFFFAQCFLNFRALKTRER